MNKKIKEQITLKRKNFFPALTITLFLGLLTASLIYFTEPNAFTIFLFFIIIFLFLLFFFSLALGKKRQGLTMALIFTSFLLLKLFGIGNIVNFLLLIGLGISIEIYARLKK